MIEGLNWAIESLERAAKKHKELSTGDYTGADEVVKMWHFSQFQAREDAIVNLKQKRRRYLRRLENIKY